MVSFADEVKNYRDKSHFMEVVDYNLWWHYYQMRYNRDTLNEINHPMRLNIVRSKGVEVEPDFEVNSTDLNTTSINRRFKMFTDTGDAGVKFKIDVIINKGETWGISKLSENQKINQSQFDYYGEQFPNKHFVRWWLNWFYVNRRPINVVTDAIDIPNATYIMTRNPTRKQTTPNYTVWSLEFERFYPLNVFKWETFTSMMKQSTGKKWNTDLCTCQLSLMKYQGTKYVAGTTTKCTRWLQDKLYHHGFLAHNGERDPKTGKYITGWFGPETREAVSKFQKKYQKYYPNIRNTHGGMDGGTLEALCKYDKEI